MSEHKIRVHSESGDQSPWLSIVCPFEANDPERPCIIVDCSLCQEDSCLECLTEHPEEAHTIDGCNYQEWHDGDGVAFVFDVELPVSEALWDGDGFTLKVQPAELLPQKYAGQ